jgi:hypothetical protein
MHCLTVVVQQYTADVVALLVCIVAEGAVLKGFQQLVLISGVQKAAQLPVSTCIVSDSATSRGQHNTILLCLPDTAVQCCCYEG